METDRFGIHDSTARRIPETEMPLRLRLATMGDAGDHMLA
jgi:hypothetical protein